MSLPYPFAFRLRPSLRVGPLAQLVEQLTLNQRVRSSSLRRPTKTPSGQPEFLPSKSDACGCAREMGM